MKFRILNTLPMKSTPIKTYLNLTKILNYYLDWLQDNNQNNSSEEKKLLKSDLVKVVLGLIWIKKDLTDVKHFQANRYFMDAIGINSLPTIEMFEIFSAKNELKNLPILKENIGINNYENIKNIALIVLDKFNSNLKIMLAPETQWGPEKKKYFEDHGYVVIPDVMTSLECSDFREIALNIAQDEKEKKVGFFYGYENKFQRVWNLVNKSLELGQLLTLPIVHQIMNDLFDRNTFHEKYLLSSFHLNIVPPGGEEQKFHLDSTVPDPLPPWLIRVNINFLVEDHNENNGALLCLPGSHKFFKKPLPSDEKKYNKNLIKLIAPKGSMIIWNGHLWHKSSNNKTTKERTALLVCFAASHLAEVAMEENHALIVDSERSKYFSDDLKRILMFNHGIKQGAMVKSKHFGSKKKNN